MRSGSFTYYFDREKADKAIGAFPILFRHTIGAYADSPFVLSPWQAFIVGSIFGWKCEDGTRRFRRAYVSIGRKNGKSTLASGIAILLAAFDGEQQSQVYIGATKVDQAKVIFDEAKRMCGKTPLNRVSSILKTVLEFPSTSSYIKPLGSDKAFDGLNPQCVLFDELHAWKELHRPFYNTLTTGSASRRQPLRFTITTAGDSKSQIWQEENKHAVDIVSGRVQEESYFVYVACLDKGDDIFDERNWIKSLPNLGVSVDIGYIREQAREAQTSPQSRNKFARYFANIEVSSAEQAIDPALWDACKVEALSDWSLADVVCGGIDNGGKDDLAATAMVARFHDGTDEDGKPVYRYEVKTREFIDVDTKRDLKEQPWESWVRNGKLFVSSQVSADLRDSLAESMIAVGFRQIGLDPWNTRQIGEELQAEGFEPVNISQTRANMNEPLTLFLNLIRKGKITHDGSSPILRWAIGNLVIDKDVSDRWMPSKKHSADKIDPVVAVLMALRLASLAPAKARGNLFIS